ncbi:MAG: MCE family protein [Myxococcales bacterium]|nr:MCE family protein [Myxococcales bacterium]MCB9537289.1 MCE family protein [Myxococcales bacterium]
MAEREEEAGREAEHEDVPEAQVREKSRLSAVWLIPLVAAAVGGWLTWKSISGMGPTITIRFDNAEGLEAGKTKIKFREFELGVIEELTLADDLGSVVATAQLKPIAEPYMTDKTRFWVVRARVTASRVTGLDTLISGAYVGVDPVEDGNPTETFEALERAPVVTSREEGRSFVLIAPGRGSINPGAPVYHRQVDVGEVVHAELDPARDLVRFDVFVRAPHDQQVRENTRFWNASGIDASVDETGLRIHTESVVAMLVGGVGFDTPADDVGERAEEGTSFDLFPSKQATEVPVFPLKVRYLTYFEGSVRGLSVGAPVEFRGIRIGQVADVSLQFDGGDFRIPVVLEIEPGRVKTPRDDDAAVVKRLEALVDEGLRAQLRTGNLLTGQLVVTLSMHPDAPPATITRGGEHPVLPSVPSQLEALTDQLQALVDKIDGLPMEGIAKELERSMGALRETLGQTGDLAGSVQSDLVPAMTRTMNEAEKSLASVREVMGGVEALIGPRAPAVVELQRLLDEGTAALRAVRLLADHLERNPEDLIRGRSEP